MNRYIQLNSLTWWAGFIPLVAGLALAILPEFPSLSWLLNIFVRLVGDIPAWALINGGLAAIGIKAGQVYNRETVLASIAKK
ncbi:MAG: hypothetical protein IM509_05335 [Microcystis sp. M31BS1]|jgi:hypothetical protein|uniref:hypothetical protein n=1 Tax=Microcystis sp. M31BS1 TaxID=2771186 RepID=UPI00258B40D3|nr:hypothetical protein [Microcystis sp. M31BS1]MCA2590173.1 hypothetical protein [Microcystis sp. M31BS1]